MICQERERMNSDLGQERLRLLNTREPLGMKAVAQPRVKT